MNYDFESFKKMYGLDDRKSDDSKDDLSDDFSVLDELDSGNNLYDELVPSNNLSEEIVHEIKEESPTPSNGTLKNEFEDKLEKTMEIDSFELEPEMIEVLEPIPVKEIKPKEKKKLLPLTVAKDHHLEYAFAHCAVLGFITAAMGSGMLIYIINHII